MKLKKAVTLLGVTAGVAAFAAFPNYANAQEQNAESTQVQSEISGSVIESNQMPADADENEPAEKNADAEQDTSGETENNDPVEKATGWADVDGSRYYFDANGVMATGWQDINNTRYYFNTDGVLMTGWQDIDGNRYYFDTQTGAYVQDRWILNGIGWWYSYGDGTWPADQWKLINGRWYWFDVNGYMAAGGWHLIHGAWYYMDGSGAMLTGWQYINGSWYYLSGSGAMLTGWQYINGNWYFLSGSGAMLTGWQYINGVWYYLSGSGAMLTGWQNINGTWYYMNGSGAMLTGWQRVNGTYYYMNGSGAMLASQYVNGWWLDADGGWRYPYQASWRQNSICWWYGDASGWYARSHWYLIDGTWYDFNNAGYLAYHGYQNPGHYYQVSNSSVAPSCSSGIFSYVTPSRIGWRASRADCVNAFIQRAYEYLGTPYVWDYACAPGVGVDCAGLVIQCLYAAGMQTQYNPYAHRYDPWQDHDANNMWNDSKFMHVSIASRQRGDIICYPGHVAIYIGNNQVIEALGRNVHISNARIGKARGVLRPFV